MQHQQCCIDTNVVPFSQNILGSASLHAAITHCVFCAFHCRLTLLLTAFSGLYTIICLFLQTYAESQETTVPGPGDEINRGTEVALPVADNFTKPDELWSSSNVADLPEAVFNTAGPQLERMIGMWLTSRHPSLCTSVIDTLVHSSDITIDSLKSL